MSADVLRRAAALMRERAGAATPGPWTYEPAGESECGEPNCCYEYWHDRVWGDGVVQAEIDDAGNAQHIASWHPVVALAVADWLDSEFSHPFGPTAEAIDVARAYLGESA